MKAELEQSGQMLSIINTGMEICVQYLLTTKT